MMVLSGYMHLRLSQLSRVDTANEENGIARLHFIYIVSPYLTTLVSPRNPSLDRSFDTEPAVSFRCQTNGFTTLYKGVMFETGSRRSGGHCRGSGGHCMILVTRYLLVSRVENEVNNDLRSSLFGSDSITGSYNSTG